MENNVKVVDCVDALIEKIAVVREAQRKFSTYSEEQNLSCRGDRSKQNAYTPCQNGG